MLKNAFKTYVAIGSSAGGFEALSELVKYLPEKTGFYYFVAQHHALGEKPILADLLNRSSKIAVVLVELGMVFKPDVLYIIPPKLKIIVKRNTPAAAEADINYTPLPNADILFSELSSIKNSKTIAIILSGTGHDGTEGMRIVKEFGGITMVQFPDESMFDSMPKHAIQEKQVDYILDIQDIALKLVKFANAFKDGTYITQELPFDEIVKLLHKEKQLDLFKYKEETIHRRIQKRMDILKLDNIKEYAKYFKENSREIDILNQEVLIGVTEFFREADAFEALKEHVKQRLLQKSEHSEFRIWSVACSSGEEAYSLAILVNEVSREIDKKFSIKIFASDIDDEALQKAREGEYNVKALESLKSEWIERYFVKNDSGYRVTKTLREQIIFAHHNFLDNPAFINMDLISCRNVLIYLKSSAQKDVFDIFHYALNPKGLLFLGSSESTLSSVDFFITLDIKHRIYEKKNETKQLFFPNQVINKQAKKLLKSREHSMQRQINTQEIEKHLQEDIFKYFRDGCLIVDSDYNIVYKKGNISYLNFSEGVVSLNLFDNLDKALHYDAKKLLNSVALLNTRDMSKFIQLGSTDSEKFVQIIAQPFNIPEYKQMTLLNFQEIEAKELLLNCADLPSFDENSVIDALTSKISEANMEIKNLSEELAFSKQNMAMMNSELQDANEKLQSTVEELETSNEEMQSSNEELRVSLASNRELQDKLSLILQSSIDGIIGLDMYARHTFVNERAAQLLGYSSEYLIGKDSHKLWHHTKPDGSYYPEEECPIIDVLRNGKSSRGEDLFWRKDGTSFPVEVLRAPIMEDGKITGVVVTFHDISEQKALEQKFKTEHEILDTYLKISGIMIVFIDLNGIVVDINDAGANILGLSKKKTIGLDWFENFVESDERTSSKATFFSILNNKEKSISHNISKIIDAQKYEHHISWSNAIYKNEKGEIIGVIATGSDITKEEFLLSQLEQSNIKYEQIFKSAQMGIAIVGLRGEWLDVNEYLCKLVGYTKKELLTLTFQDITHPNDLANDETHMQQFMNGEIDSLNIEKRYIHKNGSVIWINLSIVLLRDSSNNPLYFITTFQDISQVKMLMFELETKKNEFENIIRFAPNPMMIYSEDGDVIMLNEAFKNLTGYTLQDIPTIKSWNAKLEGAKDITEQKTIAKLFKDNVSVNEGQMKVRTKNGEFLIWIRSLAPLGNMYEGKRTIIYAATDITKMHENEEMMLAQSRQAAMGDMIGMIAHQWRQPLSVISMLANNLKADLEFGEKIKSTELEKLTDTLSEQTQFLSHTIDDFRTFLKPEKEKEKILLCDVYEKLRNMISKTLENNEIALNFVNDCNVEIYTYTNELIQVFINLLNNSKDAVKEHDIKDAKIDIITSYNKDLLKIEVKDNAGGINKNVINNLGEPYVSTKSKNGTGLGVYMSKMILQKHFGGTLSWKNCDKGSCFTIELPLVKLKKS